MASYVVMQPPASAGTDPVGDALFVKDAFRLAAFLVPPLWFAWRSLWLEAALALAAAIGLAALGEVVGLGPAGSALSLLLSLYVGFEGEALRVAALRRRGWHEWGVVDADSLDDAEARYAAAVGEVDENRDDMPAPAQLTAPVSPRTSGPALGLLAYPVRG